MIIVYSFASVWAAPVHVAEPNMMAAQVVLTNSLSLPVAWEGTLTSHCEVEVDSAGQPMDAAVALATRCGEGLYEAVRVAGVAEVRPVAVDRPTVLDTVVTLPAGKRTVEALAGELADSLEQVPGLNTVTTYDRVGWLVELSGEPLPVRMLLATAVLSLDTAIPADPTTVLPERRAQLLWRHFYTEEHGGSLSIVVLPDRLPAGARQEMTDGSIVDANRSEMLERARQQCAVTPLDEEHGFTLEAREALCALVGKGLEMERARTGER